MPETAELLDRALGYHRAGQLPLAEPLYRRVLQADPGNADVHYYLGAAYRASGKVDAAEASLRQALLLKPRSVEALFELGLALAQQARHDEAAGCFRQALQIKPDFAEACNNLGLALGERAKHDEAIACFREAIRVRPDYADAHYNLGIALQERKRPEEAASCFRQAIRVRPDHPEAYNNLGIALQELGELGDAVDCFRAALRIQPGYAIALNNLGIALKFRGELDQAVACFEQALRIKPDYAGAHKSLGMAWLLRGDFGRGWPEYEWRQLARKGPPRQFPAPAWDGRPFEGKTLLLHAEQGLGDTIQFVRYAAPAGRRGGTVVVECQPALVPLLKGCCDLDRVLAQGDPLPPFDVHAALLSLPGILETTLETVPAEVPYLRADPRLVERWRAALGEVDGFKVGIAWQGNPDYGFDRHRSIALECFAPLADVAGVRLIALQKGPGAEQLQAPGGRFPVVDLGGGLDEEAGAFMDTAAVMSLLDLVVTSDSATAHLAGALGVPVWVALPAVPDWRWLLDRDDSPWYPTMRLFRQRRSGDWRGVFEAIRDALRERTGPVPGDRPHDAGRTVTVEVSFGELLDKITILEIKARRLTAPKPLEHVRDELARLVRARDAALPPSEALAGLAAGLQGVNEQLWQVEDEIRRLERAGDFGASFIALARSVYRLNDRRAAIKRRINDLVGSALVEEKSYPPYAD